MWLDDFDLIWKVHSHSFFSYCSALLFLSSSKTNPILWMTYHLLFCYFLYFPRYLLQYHLLHHWSSLLFTILLFNLFIKCFNFSYCISQTKNIQTCSISIDSSFLDTDLCIFSFLLSILNHSKLKMLSETLIFLSFLGLFLLSDILFSWISVISTQSPDNPGSYLFNASIAFVK